MLFAAFLHALWNALLKKGDDPLIDTSAIWVGAAIAVFPFLFVLPWPQPSAWPFVGLSLCVHLAYFWAIVQAYRRGALSLVYPIMRGLAPVILTLATLAGEHEISALQLVAIALVSAGVALVSGALGQRRALSSSAFVYALITAALIASYSYIDGRGARLAGNAFSYLVWLSFTQGITTFVITLYLRRHALREAWAKTSASRALIGGAASAGAYAISLWAMTQAPIAVVAALRESSVLFAALMGAWMLKETVNALRWSGAVLVVIGVIVLRIGS